MQSVGLWALILSLVFSSLGITAAGPAAGPFPPMPAAQSSSLILVAPSNCPGSGCAGGQRVSMRFSFIPTTYDPAKSQNIEICFFAPSDWHVIPTAPNGITVTKEGKVTHKTYTRLDTPNCIGETRPAGYDVIADVTAQLDAATASDALDFSFRLGSDAVGDGQLLARLYEQDPASNNWARTSNVTSPILTAIQTPNTGMVYVTNDANGCGATVGCYINSSDDLPDGIGTGLKDAVDVVTPGTIINVMGTYAIKGSTVLVNKALTITGLNNATITNSTSGCSSAMLSLNDSVVLRDLNINDGSCASPGRVLVDVNTAGNVLIEYNTLTNGNNAINIEDNTGSVNVLFNNITGNAGYAVYSNNHSNGGWVYITANNLSGNRSDQAVDCSGAATDAVPIRRANHNYWGGSLPNPTSKTHCLITSGKVLGLPIALRSNQPGVDAQNVLVNGTATYAFNNQISYWRTGGSADFGLYIINHGYMTPYGPPFTYLANGQSPSPCSNYWDIFLPDGVVPDGTLELNFKYDKTSACIAAINSTQYCEQTSTPAKYPLYWYDPANGLTNGWDTTGQKPDNLQTSDGQVTTCHTGTNEIQVSIDNSGRPNLTNDLVYLPFMVGVPVIKDFKPLASNQLITVSWSTNNEPDISGFYVLRGTTANQLNPISDLITHTGSALVGRTYSFVDSGRTNGVTYYYRLQVVRTDGTSIFSDVKSIVANVATVTPTATGTSTRIATPIMPTRTPSFTFVPYKSPTRAVAGTFTPFPGQSLTRTPTPRPGLQTTATLTAIAQTLFAPYNQTPGAGGTPGQITPGQLTPGSGLPGDETATITLEPAQAGTMTSTYASGTGTAAALAEMLAGTPSPTTSLTLMPGAQETPPASNHPWLSLLLGILGGLATVGGIGAAWYYLRIKPGD